MNKLIKQAFTLIELLVVIAIIGVLSGLIVVSMSGVTQKATIAKAQVFSNSLRNSLLLNIVSELKFDGSGLNDGDNATTAYTQDSWSVGNSCSVNGTPKVKTGSNCINGSCLSFNGSIDYLDCGSSRFHFDNNFSISVWINPGAIRAGEYIVAKGWTDEWDLSLNNNGTVMFTLVNSITPSVYTNLITNTVFSINKWYYVVATFDGTNIKLYVNGVLDKSNPWNYIVRDSGQTCKIGVTNPSYTTWYQGLIDEVRIYNATVPVSQIKENYYLGLNSLLSNGNISKEEYQQRLANLLANK